MIGFVIVAILLLVLFLVRPITVITHELGHAIPALFFTKERVSVYIGSYREPNQALSMRFGRLAIYFKYSPFLWEVGLCSHSGNGITFIKNIIIILGGPFFSLITGLLAFYLALNYDIHGLLKVVCFVIMLSAIFDFVANLYPDKRPLQIYGGATVYNDGESFIRLLKFKPFLESFNQAEDFFMKGDYNSAQRIYEEIIKKGVSKQKVYQHSIYALFCLKEYEEANRIYQIFEKNCDLNNEDYAMIGMIHNRMKDHDKALSYYQKSLSIKPKDYITLNNLGYTYNLLEEYERSIEYFDSAINEHPKFAFPYNNRGLAKIKIGQLEEGLADIKKSLELDEKNAFAWRNLGIYFLEIADSRTANKHFQKAADLEVDIPLLQDLLAQTKHQ